MASAACQPVRIVLDLSRPERHLVGVRIQFIPSCEQVVVRLPAWTPGSYLIRDYVRHLEAPEARQGDGPLELEGSAVQGWRLRPRRDEPVEIRYRILATELTVRTCHLNADHGFLALAAVVLQVEGARWLPHRLELRLPPGWTAFLPWPASEDGSWTARTYDELIDTPVEAGEHPCHAFQVAGVPHRWVTWGGDPPARDESWLRDVERVCLQCCRLMGVSRPAADHYLFVLHLLDRGYGGLEHDRASVLQYGRRALRDADGRRKLLQLVAHEYLHQWNVRRLRPAEVIPVDYDHPTPIPTLWFAEGVTSYFDQLIPLAAGISSEDDLLTDLGADLSRYRLTPGRRVQNLRQSSQDAWVKLYRQDAHSADNQISYYLKGAVLALVLDLHLRRVGACLAEVLRELWQRFGRWDRGYRESDLIAAFAVHDQDLSILLPRWLKSTDDPDVDAYLSDVGLRMESERSRGPHLGWRLESPSAGRVQLNRVERDGPAERAGLEVGDELLAIDAQRMAAVEEVSALLEPATDPPPTCEILYCRDGLVCRTSLSAAPPVIERWRLVRDPGATPAMLAARRNWLALVP